MGSEHFILWLKRKVDDIEYSKFINKIEVFGRIFDQMLVHLRDMKQSIEIGKQTYFSQQA